MKLLLLLAAVLLISGMCFADTPTFKVIYTFSGGSDGERPANLIVDSAGNLYGTTCGGGDYGAGTVFKLTPSSEGWTKSIIHSFTGGDNGACPRGALIFDALGNLYGAASTTNSDALCGMVFRLNPSNTGWTESVLYSFSWDTGCQPSGPLVLDAEGNLYGTTSGGSDTWADGTGAGVVFKLTPSNGGWTETVLHGFTWDSGDGVNPSGVVIDAAGNLYGATANGGANGYGGVVNGYGVVYKLMPSNGGWAESLLHNFQGGSDGQNPLSGLVFDSAGNLYGTTLPSSPSLGTVFKMTPSDTGWSESVLYAFTQSSGYASYSGLIFDTEGNLYGTAVGGGAYGAGTVFKLYPANGAWTATTLYSFPYGLNDRQYPGGLVFDKAGNLYGTTSLGGSSSCQHGCGTVFEIVLSTDVTPPATTTTLSPEPNASGWNKTNVTVTLNATDNDGGSGVKQIQFELVGAQTESLQTVAGDVASVTLSAEGVTTLSYFATDNAGNQETTKTLVVRIDKTTPLISGLPASGCAIWPPNHKLVQVATISASDQLSGINPDSFTVTGTSSDPQNGEIVITGGPSQFNVQLGADKGQVYTLTATASDLAGNTTTAQATCTVTRR